MTWLLLMRTGVLLALAAAAAVIVWTAVTGRE
jgi:hypothetical protein